MERRVLGAKAGRVGRARLRHLCTGRERRRNRRPLVLRVPPCQPRVHGAVRATQAVHWAARAASRGRRVLLDGAPPGAGASPT
eukprot:1698342-Prymnesium_polylepis.1